MAGVVGVEEEGTTTGGEDGVEVAVEAVEVVVEADGVGAGGDGVRKLIKLIKSYKK